jgi:hypothetical protein
MDLVQDARVSPLTLPAVSLMWVVAKLLRTPEVSFLSCWTCVQNCGAVRTRCDGGSIENTPPPRDRHVMCGKLPRHCTKC